MGVKNTNPYSLCNSELKVLRLMAKGYTNTEIKNELIITQSTLSTHINAIYQKLQLSIYIADGKSALRVRAVLKYQEMIKEGLLDV